MKKTIFKSALLAMLGVGLMAGSAMATMFTLDDYTVNYNSTDPGLVLYATNILAEPYTADYTAGNSYNFELFTIGTDESYINKDDKTDFDISVDFSFSAPSTINGAIDGTSDGHGNFISQSVLGIDGTGTVDWDGLTEFSFGNGGLFTIELSDVTFGTPGSATVWATLDFKQDSAPVPEPATMLLFGTGLAGLAGFRRKKSQEKDA